MTETAVVEQDPYVGGAWRSAPQAELTAILEAALEEFNVIGYHGTSVRTIAERVGVTVPALYYHHKNKEAILSALMDSSIVRLRQLCRAAVADAGGDPVTEFFNLVECIVLYMAKSTKLAALTTAEIRSLSPENRARQSAVRREVEQMVVAAIAAGVEAGAFSATSAEDTARALLGMFQSIANWYHVDGELSPQALARRYIDIAGRTVGASEADVRRALTSSGG